ncbi:MAG: beta-lactamase family protein [Clostridia bacterium]|nr:beta-lactamase family protein [Clostridia bacterium]
MDFTKLKDYMDVLIKDYKTPGVDCVVYKDHEMIFRYFAGVSDIENNKPIDGNELYLIFSMTKMITCTAALQLFEQGKYMMCDPVSKYLPEFENMKIANGEQIYAKNKITIKDLFTMSAGLDYFLNDAAISNALAEGKTSTRELVGAMAEKVLGFEPGTRFSYSLCHDVLGALIEVWSGQKLGEYMKKHIFEPLNMNNTFFGVPKDEERLAKMAVRYTFDENGNPIKMPLKCDYNLSENYESGGAGLVSCTEDYAVFLDALSCGGIGKNGKRILSSATVELMGTNHLKGEQSNDFYQLRPGYGYGLGVRTHINKAESGSLSPIGEFGWDGAAGAFSMVDTKNKISLTYFQHIHNWDLRIQAEMRNALYACLD